MRGFFSRVFEQGEEIPNGVSWALHRWSNPRQFYVKVFVRVGRLLCAWQVTLVPRRDGDVWRG